MSERSQNSSCRLGVEAELAENDLTELFGGEGGLKADIEILIVVWMLRWPRILRTYS
jgi:hypothetical protein